MKWLLVVNNTITKTTHAKKLLKNHSVVNTSLLLLLSFQQKVHQSEVDKPPSPPIPTASEYETYQRIKGANWYLFSVQMGPCWRPANIFINIQITLRF